MQLYNFTYFMTRPQVVRCPSPELLEYIPKLKQVLDRTVRLGCIDGWRLSASLLRNTIRALTTITPMEHKSVARDFGAPIEEHLPLKVQYACISNIGISEMRYTQFLNNHPFSVF